MVDVWLRRVNGLLAKAEATDSAAEAETFLSKAQELIAKHNIDDTHIGTSPTTGDRMGLETVPIRAPYLVAKGLIVQVIGEANGVFSWRSPREKTVTIVGREADREIVKAMFASMLVVAERHLASAEVPFGESTKGFRNSFYLGFANRLGSRLKRVNRDVASSSGTSAALVVADRKSLAEQHACDVTGFRFRSGTTRLSSLTGMSAGQAAADRAQLGKSMGGSSQRALGG